MPSGDPGAGGTGRRVLLVINSLSRGGAETQLMGVARYLHEQGCEVVVATLIGGNDFTRQIEQHGLTVWTPSDPTASWSLVRLWTLARQVLAWRPEVTISFLLQATLFVRALNVLLRPRVAVASMRNERLETRLRTVVYRATAGLDDTIVANSHSALVALRSSRTIPRDPSRTTVIYNGVDAAALTARATADPEQTRHSLGVAPGTTLFLGVGRLGAQKDWASLVEAVRRLPGSDLVCAVAGEGPLEQELHAGAAAAGVADRVRFLGLRSDVPDLLRAADCLVLSSVYEGTPNVVLEALALGVPVIATDVGACRELLPDDDARVVPPSDPAALAAAMGRFVADRARLPREEPAPVGPVGPAGLPTGTDDPGDPSDPGDPAATAVADYDWERIGAQWSDLVGLSRA